MRRHRAYFIACMILLAHTSAWAPPPGDDPDDPFVVEPPRDVPDSAPEPASQPPAEDPPAAPTPRPALATTPEGERRSLDRLLASPSWLRRAIAAVRLERYGCDESRKVLDSLLRDPEWHLRAFAVQSLGRRGDPLPESWLEQEGEPRLLRTALRHRYAVDAERLDRGVRYLARSSDLSEKLLAAELAVPGGEAEMIELARETVATIILRMGSRATVALSSRLGALTGSAKHRDRLDWVNWLRKAGKDFALHPAFAIPEVPAATPLSRIAALEPEAFVRLVTYMDERSGTPLDLAICIDTTSSMGDELTQAQLGIDDLMILAGLGNGQLRVAIVAYRDKRARFETLGWDFTGDIELARQHLLELSAGEGGDEPEAVFPALRQAYTKLTWAPAARKVLVLVGDAPPHSGFGQQCVDMARLAFEQSELITHVIQARGRSVKHFAEIADAGRGRCVTLRRSEALIAEVTGLTLGDQFAEELREFFVMYRTLCK